MKLLLPKITKYITPSLFVFTNIFRDQMDRYGEIYTTYQMILDGAANAPQATILANGDSPLFHSKEVVNPVINIFMGLIPKNRTTTLSTLQYEGI